MTAAAQDYKSLHPRSLDKPVDAAGKNELDVRGGDLTKGTEPTPKFQTGKGSGNLQEKEFTAQNKTKTPTDSSPANESATLNTTSSKTTQPKLKPTTSNSANSESSTPAKEQPDEQEATGAKPRSSKSKSTEGKDKTESAGGKCAEDCKCSDCDCNDCQCKENSNTETEPQAHEQTFTESVKAAFDQGKATVQQTWENLTGKEHDEKIMDSLKRAYEEGKISAQESWDEFSTRLNRRYQDTATLVKSRVNEDKLKFREAVNKYEADFEEAKKNGKDKLAYYYDEARNRLKGMSGAQETPLSAVQGKKSN